MKQFSQMYMKQFSQMYNSSSKYNTFFSDSLLAALELTFDTDLPYIRSNCLRNSGLTFKLGGHLFTFDAKTMTIENGVYDGGTYTLVNLKEDNLFSQADPSGGPSPSPIPKSGDWEGWATTTQFGSGDGPWGNTPYGIDIKKINDDSTGKRMGAAVPWRYYCKWYKSKNNQTQAVADSIDGKAGAEPACFLAQPITVYPNQIATTPDNKTLGTPSFCTGGDCKLISDDTIAATNSSGEKAPEYLIVPFEGCGGDGTTQAPDVANSCFGSSSDYATAISYLNCDFSKAGGPMCGGMNALYDNGKWEWNNIVKENLAPYSAPLGISPETNYGNVMNLKGKSSGGTHLNWCSGQNMHFDIGMDTPNWVGQGYNTAKTTAASNIMMRYKRVPCNIYGTFSANAPASPGAYKKCPDGYADCGNKCSTCAKKVLKPGDDDWPYSKGTNHGCCKL